MGITADKYLVMNDLASLGTCYIRIRNFHITKVSSVYTLNYRAEILVNNKYVTEETMIVPSVETPITENIWKIAYDNLKEYLTSKGITFTDRL
jgi:hypothetical protein